MKQVWCACCFVVFLSVVKAVTVEEPLPDLSNRDIFLELLGRVKHLEKRDKEQQDEIDILKSELHVERQRTSVLEDLISKRDHGKDDAVDNELDSGVVQSNEIKSDDIGTEKNTKVSLSAKTFGEKTSRIRRQGVTPVVAFYATLSDHLHHVGVNQIIAFDNVITNIGGAYNPHVGTFIAPVTGVYVFSTSLLGYGHDEFHSGIAKNGHFISYLYLRGVESPYGSDSATVVLHLNKGDDVDVQTRNSDKSLYEFSKFSGFLLHADEPSASIVGK